MQNGDVLRCVVSGGFAAVWNYQSQAQPITVACKSLTFQIKTKTIKPQCIGKAL